MDYEHFIKHVRMLAPFPSDARAINVIRATLETLSERLAGEEPQHLASQLPEEIGIFLKSPSSGDGDRMTIDDFFNRVQRRSGERMQDLVRPVRAVCQVLREAVSPNELEDMYSQLPDDFRQLFDAGPRHSSHASDQVSA